MEPLLTLALQGTARQTGSTPKTGTPLDAMLEGGEGREPERRLLLAAGALAMYLQAGQRAEAGIAPVPASPAETWAALQGRQARLVWDLLHQRFPAVTGSDGFTIQGNRHGDVEYQAVLAEALVLAARAGRRLPEHMLPKALAAQNAAVREALLPVLGERGRWLAGLNPAWKWATVEPAVNEADLETTWLEGLPAQRLAALARKRASDPAMARQWLATSWKSEGAEFRHDAIAALETGLSLEDEPFLEAALNDRGERVRARAAQLLARLPDSALAVRMRERAESIISYDQAKERLLVALPQRIDASWQRDGVTPKPPKSAQVDEQVWWAIQALTLVPPTHWSSRFDRTPEELIAAAIQTDLLYIVLEGWSQAAIMFHDATWSGPLWNCWQHPPGAKALRLQFVRQELLTGLLTCMPPAQIEQRVIKMLPTTSIKGASLWGAALGFLRRPWSPALSRTCLEDIHTQIQEATEYNTMKGSLWFTQLDIISVCMAPACFSDALALAADAQIPEMYQFAETIQVRRMLYDEFHALRPA